MANEPKNFEKKAHKILSLESHIENFKNYLLTDTKTILLQSTSHLFFGLLSHLRKGVLLTGIWNATGNHGITHFVKIKKC